jgi:hypothetical protein
VKGHRTNHEHRARGLFFRLHRHGGILSRRASG